MIKTLYNKDARKSAQAAVKNFAAAVRQILAQKKYAIVAIPGGRSMVEFFNVLKREKNIDWKKLHFFMLDERLVDLKNEDSNFRQAYEKLFQPLIKDGRLSQGNLHPFNYNSKAADCGINAYRKELKKFGLKYDIVIAGVGEDGHIGALFPDHSALENKADFVILRDAPKKPAGRITSSVKLIQTAPVAFVFFIGEKKRAAYKKFFNNSTGDKKCPAKILKKIKNLYIITDLV
ncbi:MAG: 6-phosphogluconolactonase [Patescibacteria group bacterium]